VNRRLTTLPNGLRVVSQAMPGLETASVGLFAATGSRHEPQHLSGLAHLFEHMLFKGAGERSARALSEAIEDVGGDLNAATERDATSFTAAVLGEHVPLAVELLSDMVLRPRFDTADLEREKDVVLQELAEVEDTPSDLVFDELWLAAFADQPIGRSILGDESSIARITTADLIDWRDTRYRASGLIFAAAGKVDHDELVALAGARFAGLPAGTLAAESAACVTPGARAGGRSSDQAQLTFGWAAPAALAPDHYPARLFADIVGGGASSRLFQAVREDRGLAYSVGAGLSPYSDCGLFYVHAATARKEAAAAAALIDDVLHQASRDCTQRELDRARTQARAGLLMYLETPGGQAAYLARQLALHGRLLEPGEVEAHLAAVTLEQVRAAGSAMLAGPRARASIGVPALRAA
jgi:predicted Zn-dependent peptidase